MVRRNAKATIAIPLLSRSEHENQDNPARPIKAPGYNKR